MNTNKQKTTLAVILTIVLTFVINMAMVTFAYFIQNTYRDAWNEMEVNLIFGRLHSSTSPSGVWGSENNPYLISEPNHLINLYTLQNRADKRIINEDTVFQVSTEYGKPVYIGGINYSSLMNIQSIGTEEFPFVSKLRGVKATANADYVLLPNAENGGNVYSDTSVLGNIKVNATPNQFDIGIFGNVGPKTKPTGDTTIGDISTLVLYNVEINATSVGTQASGSDHKRFVTSGPYETNHIGLLIGHAQYAKVSDISVYYSGDNQNKHIKAFRVNAGTSAKYTTAQGVIGYYTDLIINENENEPLSSTGFIDQIGDTNTGLGLGIVYSEDVWSFMEKNVFNDVPQFDDSYPLQETFGAELYGDNMPGKRAFNIGVFTLAHSKQSKGKDKLEQIWPNSGTEMWDVSDTSAYTQGLEAQGPAKKYKVKNITNNDMTATSYSGSGQNRKWKHSVSSPYNTNNYRFMLTVSSGTKEYAIIRYGYSAVAKEIEFEKDVNGNPLNFTIPEEEINYYTFEPLEKRDINNNYPPYQTNAAFRYYQRHVFSHYGSDVIAQVQFAGYGNEVVDPDNSSRFIEGVRPLRVYYTSGTSHSVSFNASSAAASIEGVNLRPLTSATTNTFSTLTGTPANTTYNTFAIERTRDKDGRPADTPYFLRFSESTGLDAGTGLGSAAKVKLYAIRTTSGGSDSPTNTYFNKLISSPSPVGARTIDMSENILRYTGTPTSTNPSTKYTYDLQSLASLSWSDNKGKPIEKAEKALTMGDVTSYYYISSGNNPYWGVAENLPSPISKTAKIKVPEASFGFTVNGTGDASSTAKVFVVVASNPVLDVNQEITISRFGTAQSETGERTVVANGTMVLPPVPGVASDKTIPIRVREGGGAYKTFYPNLNRLLVAYEFTVPSRYTVTYFLEASIGLASFVYLSAERSAATDNNPTHENKINFPHLTEIDYVIKGNANGRSELFTVTHPSYSASLTSLYFGLNPNPANPLGENPDIDPVLVSITTGLNFTYQIGRIYDNSESKYYLYITVDIESYGNPINLTQLRAIQNNYQFEFSEWSYVNPETFVYAFADVIVMRINGYTIANWETMA